LVQQPMSVPEKVILVQQLLSVPEKVVENVSSHLQLAGPDNDTLVGPAAGEPLAVLGIVHAVHCVLQSRKGKIK